MLVRDPVHGMQCVLVRLLDSGNYLSHDVLSAPTMRKFRQAIESEGEAFRTV
jgi:hypothetical protein